MSVGRVRARHPQMILELADARLPAVGAEIRASLADDTRELLATAAPSMWIPIEHDIRAVEAVRRHVGQVTHDVLLQERARGEMGSPLFKSFVATIIRLLGMSPVTVVKQIGNGWQQVFQDVGAYEVLAIEERAATAVLRDLPAACVASSTWIDGVPVALRTLYELVNANGTITGFVDAKRDLTLEFRWRGSAA
jgi:hypothetical protein